MRARFPLLVAVVGLAASLGAATEASSGNPPVVSSLGCTTPREPMQLARCEFVVSDDSAGVFYTISWGDGHTARIPASGYATPGVKVGTNHPYAAEGAYTVRLHATDVDGHVSAAHERPVTVENRPPVLRIAGCDAGPTSVDAPVSCHYRATDASPGVSYLVDWGDGTPPRRDPPTGNLTGPKTTRTMSHTYATAGNFTIAIVATDDHAPRPLASAPVAFPHEVRGPSGPVVTRFSCSAAREPGQSARCEFHASDDAAGVFYTLDWGDGNATRVPARGAVAPGVKVAAVHAFAEEGVYDLALRATSNETPPLASEDATFRVTVENRKPILRGLACAPRPTAEAAPVRCAFYAGDHSPGVRYVVEWGDGASTLVPQSGYVKPFLEQEATHAYAAAGPYTITFRAEDSGPDPQQADPRTLAHEVRPSGPVVSSLGCTTPREPMQRARCEFVASTEAAGVVFHLDWDDGTPAVRVPATGNATPGARYAAARYFPDEGLLSVSVTATDDAPGARVSEPRIVALTVVNKKPVVRDASCGPDPAGVGATVTCLFRVVDASQGVRHEIDWGDGTLAHWPDTGYATPGQRIPFTHAYASAGAYVVRMRAVDDYAPRPLTADAVQVTMDVG